MFVDVLNMSGQPLAILGFFIVIITILFGALIFYAEGQRYSVAPEFAGTLEQPGAFPTGVFVRRDTTLTIDEVSPFRSIPYCCWWVAVTTTTVGYGDYSPTTPVGKFIGVVCFYVGVIFLALPVSVLGSNFEVVYNQMLEEGKIRAGPRINTSTPTRASTHRQTMSVKKLPMLPNSQKTLLRLFCVLDDPQASKVSNRYSLFMLFVIIMSTASFIVESIPDFNLTPKACE